MVNLSAECMQVLIALNDFTAEDVTISFAERSIIKGDLAAHQKLLILLFHQRAVFNVWVDPRFDICLLALGQQTPLQADGTVIQWIPIEDAISIIGGLRWFGESTITFGGI